MYVPVLSYVFYSLYYFFAKIIKRIFVEMGLFSVYYRLQKLFQQDVMKTEWKTHWQSPVCRDILNRQFYMKKSKSARFWGVFNLFVVFLIYLDVKSGKMAHLLGSYVEVLWYSEVFLCGVFALNAIMAFSLYLWSVLSQPIKVSTSQKKLFRIEDKDSGFVLENENESIFETPKRQLLNFSSWQNDMDSSSPSCLSVTPFNYSANSWSSNLSSGSGHDTTSNSWTFHPTSSPSNLTSTPKASDSFIRRRLSTSDHSLSSSPFERQIKSQKQLDEYLKECEAEEKKAKFMTLDESKSFMANVTTIENNPISALRNCRYQKACRSSHTIATEDDSSEIHCGDNIWYKLKISDKMLTVWSERLRKWICQTILVKLVQEIDDINNILSQMGLAEYQISQPKSSWLQQIAVTSSQNFPTLSSILPYIDMHTNQEYLIQRLKNLARGGCMSDFKWDSGGRYHDKPWCDDLPTDTAIIMHILCCYFDAHLPPEPHFPEGKAFTSIYLKKREKMSEKPVLSKDSFYIYRCSDNPPYYKVAIGEELYTLPKGRNNLFCAILIFLHHVKTKECGMLGRVNLGPSGLNILWVIDW